MRCWHPVWGWKATFSKPLSFALVSCFMYVHCKGRCIHTCVCAQPVHCVFIQHVLWLFMCPTFSLMPLYSSPQFGCLFHLIQGQYLHEHSYRQGSCRGLGWTEHRLALCFKNQTGCHVLIELPMWFLMKIVVVLIYLKQLEPILCTWVH